MNESTLELKPLSIEQCKQLAPLTPVRIEHYGDRQGVPYQHFETGVVDYNREDGLCIFYYTKNGVDVASYFRYDAVIDEYSFRQYFNSKRRIHLIADKAILDQLSAIKDPDHHKLSRKLAAELIGSISALERCK